MPGGLPRIVWRRLSRAGKLRAGHRELLRAAAEAREQTPNFLRRVAHAHEPVDGREAAQVFCDQVRAAPRLQIEEAPARRTSLPALTQLVHRTEQHRDRLVDPDDRAVGVL